MIEVYPVGSKVLIDGDIQGIVTAVSLRGYNHAACYAVEWWDGRKVESREYDEPRVTPVSHHAKPIKIGFSDGSASTH